MDERAYQPTAIALLTAFAEQEKDYNWYIQSGTPILLAEMKALHYSLISDRAGDAPYFAVIARVQRIGMLVGKMRTSRRDAHANRVLHDTLYLEFDAEVRQDVLVSAATLLAAYDRDSRVYQQYEHIFLDYAEALAEQGEDAQIPMPPPIELPMDAGIAGDNCAFGYDEVAVFSTPDSRQKCARYLMWLAQQPKLPKSVIVASTGRISKDDIQKYANTHTGGVLVVLTLSASVQGEVDLRSPVEKVKRKLPWFIPPLLLGIIVFFSTRDRLPPELVSLKLEMPAYASGNLLNAADADACAIPRPGTEGALSLTFNETMRSTPIPRLEGSAGGLTFPQPCQAVEEHTWRCPVTFAADTLNETATFAVTIAEGQDRAKNAMIPVTLSCTVESADIHAQVETFRIEESVATVDLTASARADVAEVRVGTVPAIKTDAGWQAEFPVQPVLESGQSLMISVTDRYGNTWTTSL